MEKTSEHSYFNQERNEMLQFIPQDSKKILELGCGNGNFGLKLKKMTDAEVWGAEIQVDVAQQASKVLDRVIVGDLNSKLVEFPEEYFDCIVMNDILEHLIDPYEILLKVKSKLTENGVLVCSIPNIRYFHALRDFVINKNWEYKEFGVMDRTHLRFFTFKSIKNMFDRLDYDIKKIVGINPIISWKFTILNLISCNYLNDTQFAQFAIVAKPKK